MFSLGVIPARGGSKRIPRKNIRDFCGKPLIAWTIAAAKASKLEDVIVSTEDEEIRDVAISHGAAVTTRPPELATDDAKSVDVAAHALSAYETFLAGGGRSRRPDIIVLLQPTSPLRTADHINAALDEFVDSERDSLISMKSVGKRVEVPNGCIYICTRDLLKSGQLYNKPVLWWMDELMPDIDTEADWQEAEKLMKERLCK